MPKRSDIQAQIEALQAELDGADDDEDFEIEIFKDGKGARIPFKHGKGWLTQELGISFPGPATAGATPPGAPPPGGAGAATGAKPATARVRAKNDGGEGDAATGMRHYFGGAGK